MALPTAAAGAGNAASAFPDDAGKSNGVLVGGDNEQRDQATARRGTSQATSA